MIVFGNAGGLLNLILFVFLLTFLASIFASQLFRGEIPEEDDSGEPIRVPFFDIYNSFLGMYQIFSSENWTTILYDVTNYQKAFGIAWIGASFCILWFIFANCRCKCFKPNSNLAYFSHSLRHEQLLKYVCFFSLHLIFLRRMSS